MNGAVIIDANLFLLLVVGSASRDYIMRHKRLAEFTPYDFELLCLIIDEFSEITLLPHVLAEVSNLSGQIGNPARARIRRRLSDVITGTYETTIPSKLAAQRDEFLELGLTDCALLHLCSLRLNGDSPTLLTIDTPLANRALSLGYSVIDYRENFMAQ